MAIPKEILAVERPKNTRVLAYGKNKDRFSVIQRIGCKNDGGRHIPVDGLTIGHIIDGKYVPISREEIPRITFAQVDMKKWAGYALCDGLSKDLLAELRLCYDDHDAVKIYCIAMLRVCEAGIKDYELQAAYEESFLSTFYSGVALSKNTVSAFQNNLGKAYSRIVQYMTHRTAAVRIDHHLLIDGTLKSDESCVNTLSNYSRKARIKGTRDISVIYAFDLEKMEPVCSKCFPGNMLDATAYETFISENNITSGILVGDKGFPSSSIAQYHEKHPELHYLNPLRRNAKLIKQYRMLEFTEGLSGSEWITCRKEKCINKQKWLYSFRDGRLASQEEHDWVARRIRNKNYTLEEFRIKQPEFGTIVLESDMDISLETAYRTYSSRWEIELVMRYYKHACEFDETRVHDDYSVIGSEFCNFIAVVMTYRLLNKFDKTGLFEKMTYKQIMSILSGSWKLRRKGGSEWELKELNPSRIKVLQSLGLLASEEAPEKKKRGRPKKLAV